MESLTSRKASERIKLSWCKTMRLRSMGKPFIFVKGLDFSRGYGECFLWTTLDLSSHFVEVLVFLSFEGHDEPLLLGFFFLLSQVVLVSCVLRGSVLLECLWQLKAGVMRQKCAGTSRCSDRNHLSKVKQCLLGLYQCLRQLLSRTSSSLADRLKQDGRAGWRKVRIWKMEKERLHPLILTNRVHTGAV